jgi:ribosome-binding protein aMBF1 (putative translation factor)
MVEARQARRATAASATASMTPKAVKDARAALGLTQKGLAVALAKHPISVARWEGGARGISQEIAARVRQLLSDARDSQRKRTSQPMSVVPGSGIVSQEVLTTHCS